MPTKEDTDVCDKDDADVCNILYDMNQRHCNLEARVGTLEWAVAAIGVFCMVMLV